MRETHPTCLSRSRAAKHRKQHLISQACFKNYNGPREAGR